MALPLDLLGTAPTNRVVDEVRTTDTLNKRYILPTKGTFFLKSLKVFNNANGKLLEPLTQYNVLEADIAASTRAKDELASMLYISDPAVTVVRLEYQAIGGEYEDISHLAAKIALFINDTSSSVITSTVASSAVQTVPRELFGQEHVHGTGANVFQQLSNIAEAVEAGDPAGVQLVYKFLIDYKQAQRNLLTQRLTGIRSQLDALFDSTELAQGQYLFTREFGNPKLYLGYGQFVKDSEMLFYSGPAANPDFGDFTNVSGDIGVVATKTMAYRRDDNATVVDFTLNSNKTNVNEGESVVFTLTTTGLPNGTLLPYVISGVIAGDIVQPLTGNFTVGAGGIATLTIDVVADEVTDGPKRMTIRLTNIPDVLKSVDINDTSKTISYSSWFSSDMAGNTVVSSISEGATVYLQLRSSSEIEKLYYLRYDDSSSNGDDFADGLPMTARFTDTMTIPYNARNDFLTEGNEVLVVSLCETNNISTLLTRTILQVIDASKTPTCNAFFTTSATATTPINQINEGSSAFLRLQTTNLPNGTALDLVYGGTATSVDFNVALPATANIVNNEAYVVYPVTADKLTEGDQLFTVAVNHLGLNIANTSLTIKDTSKNPTVNLKVTSDAAATNVVNSFNVPGSVYISVLTTEFANGTVVTLDFSDSSPTLLALLPNPTVNVTINNNNTGLYLLNVQDPSNTITSDNNLNINAIINTLPFANTDITVRPRLAATLSSSFVNTNDATVTTINEGVAFRLKVTATNILNTDDPLVVTYGGSATDADFVSVRPTTVKITNGIGYLDFTVKADSLQEGTETMSATITSSEATGSVTTTSNLTILDTSIPAITARFTSDSAGNNTVTQANEGTTTYLYIVTAGYANGTVLNLSYSGSVDAADLLDALPTTGTVSNGKVVIAYRWKNDWETEGDQIFTVSVSYTGITLSTNSLTVKDTSVAGVTAVSWSKQSNGSTNDQNFNEGDIAYLKVETLGIATGSTLTVTYAGNSTLTADDFDNGLPTTIITSGNTTIVPFPVRRDIRDEGVGNEFMTIQVRASTGPTESAIMYVTDTSKYAVSSDASAETVMTIKPGERYFFVVQGGGGSGGRTLDKTSSTWVAGDGDGRRGNDSYLEILTIGTPPVSSALSVKALGGGKGRGMVWGGFGSTNGVSNKRLHAEPGGASWASWDSTTTNMLQRTAIVSTNGADGGVHLGNNSHISTIAPGLAGMASYNLDMLDFDTLPNGNVLKSLMFNNGSGGGWTIDSGLPPGSLGIGGSAGGCTIGIFKNVSNQDLQCAFKGGQAISTDNTSANGGSGEAGLMGGAGFVYMVRVDDNFTYNRTPYTWVTTDIAVVTEPLGSQTSGNGLVIDIPVGKRLIATAVAGYKTDDMTGVSQTRDNMPVLSFFVKQANGKTYSGPSAAPWAKTNIAVTDERVVDVDNVFRNQFPYLRVKSTSSAPQFSTAAKPLSYAPTTINYQDGIGITDINKYFLLSPLDMQGLFYGANYGNATIPPGISSVMDSYRGHAPQGARVNIDGVAHRTQGGSAISMLAENTGSSTMRLIFYSWSPINTNPADYISAKIMYTLIDL